MNNGRITGAALVVLVSLAVGADQGFAQEREVNTVPEELMDDRAEFLRGWDEDDIEVVANFLSDADVDDGMVMIRRGEGVRDWVVTQLGDVTELRLADSRFERSAEEIEEHGRYTVTVLEDDGTSVTRSGEYEVEWVFDGDDYVIQEMELDPDGM